MAKSDLSPVPYQTPMTNSQGLLTAPWMAWYRSLMVRVGGNIASILFNPMTAVGSLIYGSTAGVPAELPGNLTTTKKYLSQTGSGSTSSAPAWIQPAFSDLQGSVAAAQVPAFTGDVTNPAGSTVTTVALVGGSSAASVHSGEQLANAATDLSTASAIVKRDASGNFSAGTITASLNGNATSATTATTASSATTAAAATAPVTGSSHGAVTLDSSGHFQSVAPGTAGHYLRSNGTDYVDSAIQAADVPTLNQNTTGSAASFTGSLTGDVTGTQGATAIAASTVTGKALTGLATGTATAPVATDSILVAIAKLIAVDALKAPLASPTFTGTVSGAAASFSGQVAVGSPNSSAMLTVSSNAGLTGTTQVGAFFNPSPSSAATAEIAGAWVSITTPASTTVAKMSSYRISIPSLGTSGVVTTYTSFMENGAAGAHKATNNAAFADNSSFTGNWFINQSGTDASVFGGAVQLKQFTTAGALTTDASGNMSSVAPGTSGNVMTSNGTAWVSQAPASSGGRAVATKTGAYTLTGTDSVILADATSAAFTVTLPAAASNSGKVFTVKKIDSSANAITVGRTGSDTIDGATSQSIPTQYQSMDFISNGTLWYIL